MKSAALGIAAVTLAALAGTGLAAPAATGAAEVAPYKVTLQISAKEAVAGEDTVLLTGTVYPKPAVGSKVVLQVKYENTTAWKRVGSTTVDKTGAYTFTEKPGTHLDRVYRAVKPADAKGGAD